jgi:putative tricarboxylic transport membrane protein
MRINRSWTAGAVALIAASLCLTACGTSNAASGPPSQVQVVVDTSAGGGSDVFARQIIKILEQTHLIHNSWTVINEPAGGGLGAMAYLASHPGDQGLISFFTTKWIVAGLTTPNAPAKLSDLIPLASLVDEPEIIAVNAHSPYQNLQQFIAAAKSKPPNTYTSTGGEITSVEHLTELAIQKEEGVSWKYLSYSGGGPRIAALLNGSAQLMVGAPDDFEQFVQSGQLRVITTITASRLAEFPNAPTLASQGLQPSFLPSHLQFRGMAAAPGMSASNVKYFENLFARLVQTSEWKKYVAGLSDTTVFETGKSLQKTLNTFTTEVRAIIKNLPKQ